MYYKRGYPDYIMSDSMNSELTSFIVFSIMALRYPDYFKYAESLTLLTVFFFSCNLLVL